MPDKKPTNKRKNKIDDNFEAQIAISDNDSDEIKALKIRFKSLFEMTNDAIFWIDAESERFILVNSKASELLGYSIEEIYSKKARDFQPKTERTDMDNKFSLLKSGKILPIYGRVFQKKSGELIPTEINLSIFDDPITNKKIIQSIVRDVTPKKLVEETIKRERQIFQHLAVTAIQKQDLVDYGTEVLKNLLEKLNFDYGSLIIYNEEEDILERIASYGSNAVLISESNSITTKESQYFVNYAIKLKKPIFAEDISIMPEIEQHKKRLESLNVRSVISWPIFDKGMKLFGAVQLTSQEPKQFSEDDKTFIESIILMFRTILERYNVELALAKISQERKALNTIINLSPVIVFRWENKIGWPVEYVSENIEVFGYSPEDFYTRNTSYSSIIHPDDLEAVCHEVEKYSQDSKCQNFTQEYRIITKSGKVRWTLNFISISRNNQGNITHFHGIVLDITERKRAQDSLNREREAFQIIANSTAIATSVDELCISIVNDLANVLDFDFGTIILYDEESKMMIPIRNKKVENFLNHKFIPISIDNPEYVYTYVARTKKAIFSPDIALLDLSKRAFDKIKKFKIKAVVTWPMLRTNGELLGILQFGSMKANEMLVEDKIIFETIASSISNVIERLFIDNARKESEQKFRAFAEQSLAGVFLFNSAGKILFANKRVEEITEYSINEILKIPITKFLSRIHPGQFGNLQESLNFSELSSIQREIVHEYKIKTKNGINKWAQINLAPIKLENDFLFAVMMIDTTKEKQIQTALERERKLLTVISEATANNVNVKNMCQQVLEGIIKVFDLQSGTTRCYEEKSGLLKINSEYGISDSEKYLLEPVSFKKSNYHVAKFARENVKLFSLDASNDPIIKQFDLIKIHNFTVYIFYPILNAKNEFLGTLQIGSKKETNLTEYDIKSFDSIMEIFASAIEHLKVLEQLDVSQQRFKRTVDTILDGITIIENNKIIYANDRMAQIYGLSKEEFFQSSPFELVDPVSLKGLREKIKEIMTNQIRNSNFEYWIIQKNGERRYIKNSLFVEFSNKNSKTIFMACSDITERKLAQDGLKQLNEELEHRVADRTEQLMRVNKELEAFSYSISHDLRSPLRSINGFSQALLEDFKESLDEDGQNYLQRIRNASIKMGTLIDDILALSKISNVAITFKEINLSKIAENIIMDYKNQNPNRKVSVNIEKNVIAQCDPTLMRTVLENLLGNAWKFTSKTSNAKIKFGTKKIDEELIYYIQDNGAGFDMAYSDKLFTLFQRLHQYNEFTGTGVGLAIVQRIINRHYGEIWGEGKIDKGATFFFKFNPTIQQ